MADFSTGVQSIKFTNANVTGDNAGKFPDFGASEGVTIVDFKYIPTDSVTEDKEDDSVEDVVTEDFDDPIAQITTAKGKKTFAMQSYDLSPDTLKYWLGDKLITESEDPNSGYYVGDTEYVLPLQAMQIMDMETADTEQRIWEYMPVKVIAKISGTRGKSGLLTVTLSGTLLGNKDKNGNKLPNYRWKPVTA